MDITRQEQEESRFPDGPWAGFYVYSGRGDKHRMDLELCFRNGLVDGTGVDDLGPFRIRGHYNRSTFEVTWYKKYATHDVWYRGFGEGRGIWGVWEIGSFSRGGFHIWPRGTGEALTAGAVEEVQAPEKIVPEISRVR